MHADDAASASDLLADIAERLPRAWIDRDVAARIVTAAWRANPADIIAVIGALAEAGHLAAAEALLPRVEHPNAGARLGAHLVPRDRDRARTLIVRALDGDGTDLQLAQFVDEDLRARR